MATGETIRLAAVADIHCSKNSQGTLQPLFAQIAASADILLLCGDLTDYGLPEEAHILTKELTTALLIPTIAVLGNHDFESCKEREVTQILCDAGIHMLDGDAVEVLGVGFAGVKGFAGGFVREAIDEALKLENALARLRTKHRIGVLHYAPIQATVEGEPPQIWPFLGSSRLEEPLTRYTVDAVFHGHAHNGCPEGRIRDTIPVYNVSLALLKKTYPDRPPYRLFELPVKPPFEAAAPERSLSAGAPVP
ncbi:MAG TPA: metallophosphoesterase [Ktedonobacterales bacterium]|nr:metallophosphoesterase [Ktedonobacterales bacterium]